LYNYIEENIKVIKKLQYNESYVVNK